MATAPLGTLLRHIRRLTAQRDSRERTDHQLLDDFTARRDEAAFAALVARHGSMVLRVCRRVLQHEQDAEDAFQATFLVLARRAGSIRKRAAVANWLYGVAHRTAMKAKRSAARRRNHEARLRDRRTDCKSIPPAWDNVQAVLDDEIQRLPDPYRSAFVLCILESKSGSQAAAELGIKEGTFWSRLGRARRLLQQRLAGRGIQLTAVLAALFVTDGVSQASVPASLAQTTIRFGLWTAAGRSAAGLIPTHIAALAAGVTRAMILTKTKVAITVLLAAGAVAAACGLTSPAAPQANPAEVKPKAEPASVQPKMAKEDHAVEVSGRVVDPEGKPLEGAKLYLGYATPHGWGLARPDVENIDAAWRDARTKEETRFRRAVATSADDGTFRFTAATSAWNEWLVEQEARPAVIAVAAGFGPDWAPVKGKLADITLRLVRDDLPIRGRILNEDGQPVAGAKVRVVCLAAESERSEKKWAGPVPGQPAKVTTGGDGRFELTGLGRNREVTLRLEGRTIQHRQISAMTRPTKPADKQPAGFGLPASFDFVAATSRPIRGVVRDKASDKPLAGVRMTARDTQAVTYTDSEGRYELLGHPKGRWYTVTAQPQNGQLYFAAWKGAADTPGLETITMDFQLAGEIALQGKVTDRATGQPLRRAVVQYYPLYPNEHIRKIPDYPEIPGAASGAVTGHDGSYCLPVLPGPGVLCVSASPRDRYAYGLVTGKQLADLFKDDKDHGDVTRLYVAHAQGHGAILQERYSALALIDPTEGAASVTRDIALEPARTLKGMVLGSDGKPLAGATVMLGLHGSVIGYPEVLEGADFVVRRMTPGRTRELVFEHKEKGLGKFVAVPGEQTKELIVQLQPYGSASGRMLDKDNKPVADVKLRMGRSGFVAAELPNKTDSEGRFRVDGLIPGQKYWVMGLQEGLGWSVEFTAQPGRPLDLGDLHPR